jgi:hypothetical protein
MTPERTEALQKVAESLAEALPLEEKGPFIKDYMDVMVGLNDRIDKRLELFEEECAPVITALIPRSPRAFHAARDAHVKTIKEVTELVMSEMTKIAPISIRVMVSEALLDILKDCSEAVVESHIKSEKRAGTEVM